MFIAAIVLAAVVSGQQADGTARPDATVLDAKLGGECSADFTVKAADGTPVYAASVHVRVRYGFLNIKRADLEVGTNSDGRARLEHLPGKARVLLYDVSKDGKTASVEQDVQEACRGVFEVSLK